MISRDCISQIVADVFPTRHSVTLTPECCKGKCLTMIKTPNMLWSYFLLPNFAAMICHVSNKFSNPLNATSAAVEHCEGLEPSETRLQSVGKSPLMWLSADSLTPADVFVFKSRKGGDDTEGGEAVSEDGFLLSQACSGVSVLGDFWGRRFVENIQGWL